MGPFGPIEGPGHRSMIRWMTDADAEARAENEGYKE
jgi:hypothetical protein